MESNSSQTESISGSEGDVDETFREHLKLLSLDSRGRLENRETWIEELRTTPLFSGHVKDYADDYTPADSDSESDSAEWETAPILPQYGLLAGTIQASNGPGNGAADSRSHDPRIFLNVNAPWSAFICGSQGSGKSHSLSCILENCLYRSSRLGQLPKPLAGIVFHYDSFTAVTSSQICEAAYLCSSGIPVRVLVSPSNYHVMKKLYSTMPGLPDECQRPTVEPLLLKEKHLNIERMMMLMAVSDGSGAQPLYIESIRKVLRNMAQESQGAAGLKYKQFKKRLALEGFTEAQNAPLKLRLELLESFLEGHFYPEAFPKAKTDIWKSRPGELTIVDLSCPFVDAAGACALFDMCLSLFLEHRNDVGRIIALDEAHKFMTETAAANVFTDSLLSVIRQQRHLATRVVIATQEPTISPKLLDLCSFTLVHRFTSPAWLDALSGHLAGVSWAPPSATTTTTTTTTTAANNVKQKRVQRDPREIFESIVKLDAGEALLFSPSSMMGLDGDDSEDGHGNADGGVDSEKEEEQPGRPKRLGMRFLKVRVRKRITVDGGRSILAK